MFAEIDGDGDGSITNEEFINGIGMLKREVLEIMQLEASFTRLRANARRHGGTYFARSPFYIYTR